MVHRKNNNMIVQSAKPKINKTIVSHKLNKYETMIYLSLKRILKILKNTLSQYKNDENTEQIKKFSSYLLVIIMYTRTFLVCPLITLSTIYLDIYFVI